jgi:hypothetical protein
MARREVVLNLDGAGAPPCNAADDAEAPFRTSSASFHGPFAAKELL